MKELVIVCNEAQAEEISDVLIDLGALSVSVEDADKDTEHESPLFGEPGLEPEVFAWQRNQVIALLPEDTSSQNFLEALKEYFNHDFTTQSHEREMSDQDWVRLTQSQFDPICVSERIWIVPSWHQDNPEVLNAQDQSDNIFIQLDPGLAFGTGSHPTTHLCAEWLEAHAPTKQSVLDYGCGSGILAIIAEKLGAHSVVGVDIDEQAVESARYNAQVNESRVQCFLPNALPDGQYDVVVANILSNPLKILAPMLCSRVALGGHLVLSGILERQATEVADCYAPWIKMSVWKTHEGWVCLSGQKHENQVS